MESNEWVETFQVIIMECTDKKDDIDAHTITMVREKRL